MLVAAWITVSLYAEAQSVLFPDDTLKRGYYDRPYKRYEAEPGRCQSNGNFLSPTHLQSELQSEASNQQAVQLLHTGSYVRWRCDETADGMVVRFSIPDGPDGRGTRGTLALEVDGRRAGLIVLDSYWAWQYSLYSGQSYPDINPGEDKFARMRFDEVRVKLDASVPKDAIFSLVKLDGAGVPYTVDFVELEPVPQPTTFALLPDNNKIEYTLRQGSLEKFIADNGGRTIYIPPGRYEVAERIVITAPGTKIIGAGMWHTEIFFSAPADNAATFDHRGIRSEHDETVLEGLFLNTANDRRRFDLPDGRSGLVGKGLSGSMGKNSVIRQVWAEHFGGIAWFDGAVGLLVERCRFRNSYADGINLCFGSRDCTVEHCSFRNNGDDDMATWSRSTGSTPMCERNTFRFCSAENNWRASSVGFFGGRDHKAHDLVVIDPMEAGLRVVTDFPGREFSDEGMQMFERISVYNAGTRSGKPGFYGKISHGNAAGAVHISSAGRYLGLCNVTFADINIINAKWDAVVFASGEQIMKRIHLRNININGAGHHGIYFDKAKGEASCCNIHIVNTTGEPVAQLPDTFNFLFEPNCKNNL